jgi:uncharacterized membrane protein (DUF485 family)
MSDDASGVAGVSRARQRVSLLLSLATLAVYFGFILSVAFAKEFMGTTIAPGLSYGILFGALVIVASFALTGIYAHWANRHDASVSALDQERP